MNYPAQEFVQWRDVTSSNILKVGWDQSSNMYVLFRNREYGPDHQYSMYKYVGVPRQRTVAMIRAKSVGRYLNKKIKPFFEAIRIT